MSIFFIADVGFAVTRSIPLIAALFAGYGYTKEFSAQSARRLPRTSCPKP